MNKTRRPRAEVDQILINFRSSGLTQLNFAKTIETPVTTLKCWIQRERREQRASAPTKRGSRFVPLKTVSSKMNNNGASLTVVLENGRRVEIPASFPAKALSSMIFALESKPC